MRHISSMMAAMGRFFVKEPKGCSQNSGRHRLMMAIWPATSSGCAGHNQRRAADQDDAAGPQAVHFDTQQTAFDARDGAETGRGDVDEGQSPLAIPAPQTRHFGCA